LFILHLDQCATQTSLPYPETLSTSFYVPTPSTPHYIDAVVAITGLVEALVLAGTPTKIAALLRLKGLHIVVLAVHLDMGGTSLCAALLWNVANDAVAELADLRTNVFSGFEGADTDDCIANQACITRGRADDRANEEERFVVDAVERFAETLDAVQLFGAIAPVLVLVAAFDDACRVSGVAEDCPAVEDVAQIADCFA
jgi:hypothetical protein